MIFKIERYAKVQALIAMSLNLGELINGYGVAWSAPVMPKFDDPKQSPLAYDITADQKSWVVSIIYFGFFGAYLAGYLANVIGRKQCFLIGGIFCMISYLILAEAWNLAMVYVARILVGVNMSLLTVAALMYNGEIASPNIRGIILTSMGVFHALGGLVVYSIGPYVNYSTVGYVAVGLNVLYVIICCFLPESPVFYVLRDDETSARKALEYLGRREDIDTELKLMMDRVHETKVKKEAWRELFTSKTNRMSAFITILLSFFQQSSGIIAVILYATSIFESAASSIDPPIATIIVGATFTVGTIISPLFIEKYGRRLLLMISTAGCCLSMTALGFYFYLKLINHPAINDMRWLPLALLVLAIFSYSVGLTIIPNTLTGELFTPKVRGLGASLSLNSGWISGFLSNLAFGYIVVNLGEHVTFWAFAVVNALAFLFTIVFVPETKGRSLMEIQNMMENRE